MADPIVFFPKLTAAGAAEAFNASNNGLELEIDSVSFGTGTGYDPTGNETALVNEVASVAIPGGTRINPSQIRLITNWNDPDASAAITEIGYWSGSVLVFIWSRSAGGPIGFKTAGVDFVLFHDIRFTEVPEDSINVSIDPDLNAALAALMAHESASNAHPQYLLRRDFADAHELITATTVAGSANAITLTLPAETVIADYKAGHQFVFVATANNTDAVTVNVNGLGSKAVIKNGVTPLSAGDIAAGSVYTIFYDGDKFQLSAGVSGGGSVINYPYIADEAQTTFAANYVVGNVYVFRNGRVLQPEDFTATNGTSVILDEPAELGDDILIVAFKSFHVPDTYLKGEIDDMFANATVTRARVSDASTAGRHIMAADITAMGPNERFIRLNTDGTVSYLTGADTRTAIGANDAANLTTGEFARARFPAIGDYSGLGDVVKSSGDSPWTLTSTGVTAGIYGTQYIVPRIEVDAKGRIQTITQQAIPSATEVATGLSARATLDQVNAGVVDSGHVTPYKMRFGFSAVLGSTGHIKFPSWMLGIEFRWGSLTVSHDTNLPVNNLFTNNCFSVTGSFAFNSMADYSSLKFYPNASRGFNVVNSDNDAITCRYWAVGN